MVFIQPTILDDLSALARETADRYEQVKALQESGESRRQRKEINLQLPEWDRKITEQRDNYTPSPLEELESLEEALSAEATEQE